MLATMPRRFASSSPRDAISACTTVGILGSCGTLLKSLSIGVIAPSLCAALHAGWVGQACRYACAVIFVWCMNITGLQACNLSKRRCRLSPRDLVRVGGLIYHVASNLRPSWLDHCTQTPLLDRLSLAVSRPLI